MDVIDCTVLRDRAQLLWNHWEIYYTALVSMYFKVNQVATTKYLLVCGNLSTNNKVLICASRRWKPAIFNQSIAHRKCFPECSIESDKVFCFVCSCSHVVIEMTSKEDNLFLWLRCWRRHGIDICHITPW